MSLPRPSVRPARGALAAACALVSCIGVASLAGCAGSVGMSTAAIPTATGTSTGDATASLRQPQLGYLWLPGDQTLRPLLGVVGAAYLGASLTDAGAFVAGAASPVSGIALLIDGNGEINRMVLPGGAVTAVGSFAATAKTTIRFSPSGVAAVIFTPGSASAMLVTGLTGTPQLHALAAGTALLESAVSDAGTVVALLPAQGGGTAVALLRSSGAASPLASLAGGGDLSFTGTGDDLLTVDSAANRLTLIHTVSTAPNPVTVTTAGLLKTPVAVGAATSGRWAVAVNSAESSVVRVDLTGQTAPQKLLCPAQPSLAEPLASGAFRFSPGGTAPAWATDITASTPAMFFVPALPAKGA